MRRSSRRAVVLAAAGTAALAALASEGQAQEARAGPIVVGRPWTRPTPGTATPGVAYMVIENGGPDDDRLVAAASPSAASVTMHRTEVSGGIARMRPQADGIAIPARGSVGLEPGGYHLMLDGLARPLALGETVPLTLTFEKAGTVAVELRVERPPTVGSGHGGSGH